MINHSRFICRILLISVTLFLVSCATTNKVTSDFRQGAQFNDLRTFTVTSVNFQLNGIGDPAQVQGILEQQLGLRNFSLDQTNPDMRITAQIFTRTTQGANTGIGIGLGLPIGRHASIGLGTGQLLQGRNKSVAVLVVDVVRSSTNELLWRGTADAIPLDYFLLSNQFKLTDTVRELLEQFPPK